MRRINGEQKMAGQTKLKGHWCAKLYGSDGVLKEERSGFNVVTTNGKEALAEALAANFNSGVTQTWQFIALGTDSTAEAVGQTALVSEVARHTGVVSYVSGALYQVTATFAAGSGTGAIVEYGLFNSNAAGVMLTRDVEAAINKGASDTLTVVHQVTIG
jgi:hypothetical protein